MSGDSSTEIIVAIAALLLMTVAATIDATATLVSRHRLRQIAEERGNRTLASLLDPRRSLVASLQIVQAVAIVTAASLLTTVIQQELGTAEHILPIVLVGGAFLLFGQALPRAIASTHPEKAATVLIGIAGVLSLLARPLMALVSLLSHGIAKLLPGTPDESSSGSEEDLRGLTRPDDDGDVIEPAERKMIEAVLHLEETSARDLMVPRVDVVAVEESTTLPEIVATITGAGHSRVPVYRESIDHIVGVLYAKDLLPFVFDTEEQPPLADLLRPTYVVPESKRVDDLLTELRRNRVHIAIVADEYGGTAGLITIEDILEEIVGEIQDEYDDEAPLVSHSGADELIVDGRLPIEDAAEALSLTFRDDDYDTVAGFVHRHLGHLPKEGEQIAAQGLRVEVLTVEGRRLRRLRLTRTDDPQTEHIESAERWASPDTSPDTNVVTTPKQKSESSS